MEITTAQQSQLLIGVASNLIQLFGWPALVIGAWKMRGWLLEAEENFANRLDKLTENHLQHIQAAMEISADAMKDVAIELRELRNDVRSIR